MKQILFDIKNKNIIKAKSFKKEKDIQKLVEEQMYNLFGITFLKSEWTFKSGSTKYRIDSLGITQNKTPVIFEYKLNQNNAIISQVLSYSYNISEHPEKIESIYWDVFNEKIKIQNKPIIICIAQSFITYDVDVARNQKENLILIEYKIYEKDLIVFNFSKHNLLNIDLSKERTPKISSQGQMTRDQFLKVSNSEEINYFEQKLKNIQNKIILELYEIIKKTIISLNDLIVVEQRKYCLNFGITIKTKDTKEKMKSFVSLVLLNNYINLYLNIKFEQKLKKHYSNVFDVTKKGHWGNGDVMFKIKTREEFKDILDLIKYSLNINC